VVETCKGIFFNRFTNFSTSPASGIHFCVDFGGLVLTSRIGAKYVPRLIGSVELFSQAIQVAMGTRVGRILMEVGNKLAQRIIRISDSYRKLSCNFSIFKQLQNYFCTTLKLLNHSAASSQTSSQQQPSSRLEAKIRSSFPIKILLQSDNQLRHDFRVLTARLRQ
jgi:hypothetical protein